MTPISMENLEEAGYRRFIDSFERDKLPEWYIASFQKRFDDEQGKRYFITVAVFRSPAWAQETAPWIAEYLYQPRDQFIIDDEDNRMSVELLVREDHTIEWMEAQFQNLWEFYGYYYEKN